MILLARRFLRIAVVSLIFTLAAWGSISLLPLAQEPPPLKIDIVPQAKQAVAGRPFTYTVIVTHTGQTPLKELIVYLETPTGTTFLDTSQVSNWIVSEPDIGQSGKIGWATVDPIAPGQVITFAVGLTVLAEMADRQIRLDQYGIVPMGGEGFLASGSPVTTQVLLAGPAETPALAASPTATPTGAATVTPSPSPSQAATVTPTSTSTESAPVEPAPTVTVQPVAAEADSSPSILIFLLIGLFIVIGGGLGLAWFFKRQ